MLKTAEVAILEERWKEFKNRRLFKKTVIVFFVLLVFLLLVLLYLIVTTTNAKNMPQDIIASNNTTVGNLNATTQSVVDSTIVPKPAESLIQNAVIQDADKTNNSNKNITKAYSETKIDHQDKSYIEANTQTQKNRPQEIIKPPEEKKIFIETSDIQNIDTLIDKFESTNNVIFATMISEEFFDRKNYKKSLEWALKANDINPNNELSWIMFAKNQVQLGNKDDAIRALEGFLNYSKNATSASSLLQKIKTGEYK